MTEHKHAAVLVAIAEGRAVECRANNRWREPSVAVNPLSYPHIEWRIKPEPSTPREGWVMPGSFYPLSRDPVKAYGEQGKQAIYVREVLPDE